MSGPYSYRVKSSPPNTSNSRFEEHPNMRIPFVKPDISAKEENYLMEVLQRGQLAGNGDFNQRCQIWLEKKLSAPAARMVTSCTAALEMSAILADIQPGDEV